MARISARSRARMALATARAICFRSLVAMANLFGAGRVQGACDVSYESQCPCHGCAECWRGVSAAFWARRRKTGGSHANKRFDVLAAYNQSLWPAARCGRMQLLPRWPLHASQMATALTGDPRDVALRNALHDVLASL